jgi:thymidine kinase
MQTREHNSHISLLSSEFDLSGLAQDDVGLVFVTSYYSIQTGTKFWKLKAICFLCDDELKFQTKLLNTLI